MTDQRLFAALVTAGALAFAATPPAHAQSVIPGVAPDPVILRLQERLDQLDRDVRQAVGENERLRFELERAKEQIARLENHVDRLLEGEATPAELGYREPAGADDPAEPDAPPLRAGDGPIPADPDALFNSARTAMNAARYETAAVGFEAFIAANPDDPRVPEARYWLGQALLAVQDNPAAAREFLVVARDHARSPLAPNALVSLGVALGRMGERQRACAAFADLPRLYPRADQSVRAQAAREAAAAGCR